MNTQTATKTGEGNAPRGYHDKLRFAESHISAQRTQLQELQTDLERCKDYAGRMTAQRDELLAALTKIAEREWQGEDKTWRSEAIEMQDEARAAISKAEQP